MSDKADDIKSNDAEWSKIPIPGDFQVMTLSENIGQVRLYWRSAYLMSIVALLICLINSYLLNNTNDPVYYAATWSGKVYSIDPYLVPVGLLYNGDVVHVHPVKQFSQLGQLGEDGGLITSEDYVYQHKTSRFE
jgi:hypothetical protein